MDAFKELHKGDQNLAIGFMNGLAAKYDHKADAKENVSYKCSVPQKTNKKIFLRERSCA